MSQTVVATGMSAGFGRLTAAQLLSDEGVHLVTHHRGAPLAPHPRLHDSHVDLADLHAVDAWADDVRAGLVAGDLPPLVAIVANAGLQVPSGPAASVQGLELTIAVNHLAHVRLVDHLVDLVQPGGRVVITSSGTHRGDLMSRAFGIAPPRLEPAARMAELDSVGASRAEGMRRYATAKLANALHVVALAEAHPSLRVVAFDPGLVPGTGLARSGSRVARASWRRLAPVLRLLPGANPPAVPAQVLADLALGRTEVASGAYVEAGRGVRPAAPAAQDAAAARVLLAESRALLDRAVRLSY